MTGRPTEAEAPVLATRRRTPFLAGFSLQPRISLRGITKRWDKQKPPVLDNVDLVLEPGRLVSIVGGNGVGKTTLLRIAAGLIFPDAGTVRIDGLDPRRNRRKYQERVGFVSAGSSGLYARLSPAAHLDYWARLALLPRARRRTACVEAIARFQMDEFATRRVDRISMGQRQRVRLALAFLHQPSVLLLDEPWNSLDAEGIDVLVSALRDFTEKGGTAVCCSPTGEAIDRHADDKYLLASGGIEAL